MNFFQRIVVLFIAFFFSLTLSAHPLGDIYSFEEDLYWVYVCPIQSQGHQACVMKLNKGGKIEEVIRSKRGASDWILSRSVENQLYFIERYYSDTDGAHVSKMYRLKDGIISEVTDWYKDEHRIGEGGFIVLDNNDVVFASRGKIKIKDKNGNIYDWPKFSEYLQKFRVLHDGTMLLIQEKAITQIDVQGKVLKQWKGLIQKQEGNPPIMGNRIFDADYQDGKLYIAYWGNRRFEEVTADGKRKLLKQYDVKGPWIPHSISAHQGKVYGLASHLMGQNPRNIHPELSEFKKTKSKVVWRKNR